MVGRGFVARSLEVSETVVEGRFGRAAHRGDRHLEQRATTSDPRMSRRH